jgi:hypothetical protein
MKVICKQLGQIHELPAVTSPSVHTNKRNRSPAAFPVVKLHRLLYSAFDPSWRARNLENAFISAARTGTCGENRDCGEKRDRSNVRMAVCFYCRNRYLTDFERQQTFSVH